MDTLTYTHACLHDGHETIIGFVGHHRATHADKLFPQVIQLAGPVPASRMHELEPPKAEVEQETADPLEIYVRNAGIEPLFGERQVGRSFRFGNQLKPLADPAGKLILFKSHHVVRGNGRVDDAHRCRANALPNRNH